MAGVAVLLAAIGVAGGYAYADHQGSEPSGGGAGIPVAAASPAYPTTALLNLKPDSNLPPLATDVIDLEGGDDTGLIETPESAPRRAEPEQAAEPVAEEAPKEDRPRRARGPRKPKGDKPDGEPPKEAAE